MPKTQELATWLEATVMVDSDHPAVQAFARSVTASAASEIDMAVRLYYAVRDRFRYDPYKVDLSESGLKASRVLADTFGWCVPKAALLAASCRVVGLPARVGFADVKNHLSTERLRNVLGTDVFYWHGYASIYLNGRWLKVTPAFNAELCRKLGLHTLEFDGTADSINHPFDLAGHKHMEYLSFRGEFDDVPREQIIRDFDRYYPRMPRLDTASWEDDVASEFRHG